LLPQLADTADVVAFARTIPGLTVAVLVPNLKGAEAAVAAGVHKLTLLLWVSETHSLKDVRRTHAQMLDESAGDRHSATALLTCRASAEDFEGGLSTAFGCTLEGRVSPDKVVALGVALMEAGCDEVGLSDTTGYANPQQVKDFVRRVRGACGAHALLGFASAQHARGLVLANVMAGLEVGITTFDSSLGGLGGCPFAPGASPGNIVTEDSCSRPWVCARASTCRSCSRCATFSRLRCRAKIYRVHAPEAGLPLGFVPATAH
jgi:hydroxymethylglutaryl-CoA lyase